MSSVNGISFVEYGKASKYIKFVSEFASSCVLEIGMRTHHLGLCSKILFSKIDSN
jgi:hypothetical protein